MRGFRHVVRPTVVVAILVAILGAGWAALALIQRRRRKAGPPAKIAQVIPQVKTKVPVIKIAPPTPIQMKRVEIGGPTWKPAWDRVIELSLPHAMLTQSVPRDVRRFCPRFYRMDTTNKREFWAYFFQALAAAEAGLNPRADVRHTQPQLAVRDRVTGKIVRSEGLLQLAYEDAKRYGCHFNWAADRKLPPRDPARTILNPADNLKCGIKILSTQIIKHHKPLLSPSGYWETLRPGTPGYRVFKKQVANAPLACRVPPHELAKRHSPAPAVQSNSITIAAVDQSGTEDPEDSAASR